MAGMMELLDKVERLLKEFHQDLKRALVGGNQVDAAIKRWEPKRKALEAHIKQEARRDPVAKLRQGPSLYVRMVERLNSGFRALGEEAKRTAASRTPRDTSGLAGTYNKIAQGAFKGLANVDLDKEAEKGIKKGIESLLQKHVGDKIPSNVRSQMGAALAAEVMKSPFTREATFWAESVIVNLAGYLDRRLTISKELGQVKKSVEGKKLPPAQVDAVKKAVAPRAQAAVALDNAIKNEIEKTAVRFKLYFKLKPHFDLKPAVLFVKKVDSDLGLSIKGSEFEIKLGTAMTLTTPLTDPKLTVHPYLNMRSSRTGTDFKMGVKGDVTKFGEANAYAHLTQKLGQRTTLNLGYTGTLNKLDEGKVFGKMAVKINPNASLTAGFERQLNKPSSTTATVGFTLRF